MQKPMVFLGFVGLFLVAHAQSFSITFNYTTNPLFNGSSFYLRPSYGTSLEGLDDFYFGIFSTLKSNLSATPFSSGVSLTINPNVNYSLPSYSIGPLSVYPYVYLELTTNLLPSFSFSPFLEPGIPVGYDLGDGWKLGGSLYGDLYFLPSPSFYLSSFGEVRYTPPVLKALTLRLGSDQYYLPSFSWDIYAQADYTLDANNTSTLWFGYGPVFSAYLQHVIRF